MNERNVNELDLSIERSEIEKFYNDADKGTRFVNFLVDSIFSTIIMYAIMILIGAFIAVAEDVQGNTGNETMDAILGLAIVFFAIFTRVFYYVFFEHFNKGKTLAKMITNTRVVTTDGDRPAFLSILGRSLARYIPFEPFSFFGSSDRGWHDTLSGTRVIKEN